LITISLKLDGSYMFRSTTIIRELAIVPGYSYIHIKTSGKHSTQYTRHTGTCCHTTA